MKIINWSEVKGPTTIPANGSCTVELELHAADEDMLIGYIVVLGYEDLKDLDESEQVVPSIFMKAVKDAEALRDKADLVPELEAIIAAQAERIAEYEQLTERIR